MNPSLQRTNWTLYSEEKTVGMEAWQRPTLGSRWIQRFRPIPIRLAILMFGIIHPLKSPYFVGFMAIDIRFPIPLLAFCSYFGWPAVTTSGTGRAAKNHRLCDGHRVENVTEGVKFPLFLRYSVDSVDKMIECGQQNKEMSMSQRLSTEKSGLSKKFRCFLSKSQWESGNFTLWINMVVSKPKKIVSHPYPRPHRTVECRARTAHLVSPTAGRVSSWNLQWAREPEDASKPWWPGQFRYGFTVQWNSFGLIQIKSLKKVMTSKDKYWLIWMQWIRPHLTTMVGPDRPSGRDIFPITSYITFGDWRLVLLGLRTGFLWIMDHTES